MLSISMISSMSNNMGFLDVFRSDDSEAPEEKTGDAYNANEGQTGNTEGVGGGAGVGEEVKEEAGEGANQDGVDGGKVEAE